MPDFYAAGEYDLAGFVVGVAEKSRLVNGSPVRPGRPLDRPSFLGTSHQRLHTGTEHCRGPDGTWGHRSIPWRTGRHNRGGCPASRPPLLSGDGCADARLREIRAMAHITGGGIKGNLPRVLPSGLGARIDCRTWTVPNVFGQLAGAGGVAPEEMYRVFNMGVGMILVVRSAAEPAVLTAIGGEAWSLGEVTRGSPVVLDGVH